MTTPPPYNGSGGLREVFCAVKIDLAIQSQDWTERREAYWSDLPLKIVLHLRQFVRS